ncbi:SSL2 DNA or RNA helicases of superfamily II [uncultured Caudovirales phage]|uniref:SSL2 DNA or RNA helicases of superfamily II n=1 Tax=uncultured Caudovirales phage TaxID=2100421 RepID=A0A6J5P5F2_9CAUD|nr:SSL2 DNA or RNA helicases of superfamily II [uncultured Caudovirales phage]CAB4171688.1 SSL2 DNA or RNA helicases of superfamily II [uncultured Caudovirales phage]CAB4177560.1 SSL2 DNA or RNA helicases of superfamily II [uncultured Caudovirales phage]CAB4202000.1 SSL2 DNA or RNA helicases of superfamily II [uncultured Caudovirales phage]
MQLRPYQEDAADFLYERDRAMVLAPVGAGKTAITLTAIRDLIADGVIKRALVIAPLRVAVSVWHAEAKVWAPELNVGVACGEPQRRHWTIHNLEHQIVTTNYENLIWLSNYALKFDLIVFDELTRLKNPSGARFKALSKVIDRIPIRWGLTGSFTSNGLEDVFGQCKIIDQKLLGRSKGAFMQQYFTLINKEYNQWVARSDALPQVMRRIKPATYVLANNMYTLPQLLVVEVAVAMPDRTAYENMKKHFLHEDIVALTAATVTQKLQQLSSGFAYDIDQTGRWYSTHKLDRLEELLNENQNANTIIVYQYKEELAELKRRFKVAILENETSIDKWNRGETPLLAVHPASAGHGLNLQHGGHNIVFLSLPWSLELFEQTVGRLHRSGQKSDVWCYVMLTENSIDEKIWMALHDKKSLAEIALEELKS